MSCRWRSRACTETVLVCSHQHMSCVLHHCCFIAAYPFWSSCDIGVSSIQLTSGALSQSLGRLRRRPNRSPRFAFDAPSNLLCFVFVEDRSCCEARENALGGHKLEPNVRAYLCAPDTASSRPLLSRIRSDEFQ